MLSEPARGLDFSRRAELSEWMDEPCEYEEFQACLRDLARVNRLVLAYRPTRVWLERLVERAEVGGRPLHIVDVGSGQGDMLRFLARWARRRGIALRLTGVDLNPYAARAAAAATGSGQGIKWVTGDAFSYAPADGIDVVISSLFTHHLPDEEIVRFVAWMERVARMGWFINDLHRSEGSYRAFRVLAWAARWHRFVQHDGPVSIRRSFRREDWVGYLSQAGVEAGVARIEEFRPGRLCVGRLRG